MPANRQERARRYLGGEMELYSDQVWGDEAPDIVPQFRGASMVSTGRTGIKLVLQTLKDKLQGPFLLPAYLCPSVLIPFAELDIPVDFFAVDDQLTTNPEDLLKLVQRLSPSGLMFIDYFGFPPSEQLQEVLREIKKRCWVIEDSCQSPPLLDGPAGLGNIGHFVVTSFRKYLPVPDGGLVINRTENRLAPLPYDDTDFARFRFLAKLIKGEFLRSARAFGELEQCYLTLFAAAENGIDTTVPMVAMSSFSSHLLSMTGWEEIRNRRQQNFNILLSRLLAWEGSGLAVDPLIKDLPGHVCPLVFPIRVHHGLRDFVRQEMKLRNVFCPIHWQLPREVSSEGFPAAHKLAREILGLPIDQRYHAQDMEIVAEHLHECVAASA